MYNIRKIGAWILIMGMLMGLVGCGGDGDVTEETGTPEETTVAQGAPATESAGEETTAVSVADGSVIHENTYFTVKYYEEDGWTLTEDDFYMWEEGGNADLRILDAEGYTEIMVEISAYEDDAESFRETLHSYEMDERAYVAGELETVNVGGQLMLYVDRSYGDRYFFGRDEGAGVTFTISADNWEDPRVSALVDNITFTATDVGNVDPPWYWEGEPFFASSGSAMVGEYTLVADFMHMNEPLITFESFEHDIAVVGERAYILSDGVLYQYSYDGGNLTFLKEIPLEDEYGVVEKGATGQIVLSAFMAPVIGHNGETQTFSYEGPEEFAVAPGGEWGISWFVHGDECERYTFRDGTLMGKDFFFPEVDIISNISIDSKYILVSGTSVEDDEHYLFVYDHSGALQLQLGGEPNGFGLGSISYAVSTDNGFLAIDANMREVVLWTTDGTWIGAADDGDLFSTYYPWIASADMTDDGSILVVMCETRPDESADEVIVFKLSGF